MTENETPPTPDKEALASATPPEPKPKGKRGGFTSGSARMQREGKAGGPMNSKKTGRFKEAEVKEPEAFIQFCSMGPNATLQNLHEHYQSKKVRVSLGSLAKWSAKHGWVGRRREYLQKMDPEGVVERLRGLSGLSQSHSTDSIDGLIALSLTQLDIAIKSIHAKDPKDVGIMLDNLERLLNIKALYRARLLESERAEAMARAAEEQDENSDSGSKVVKLDDRSDMPKIGEFQAEVRKGGEWNG